MSRHVNSLQVGLSSGNQALTDARLCGLISPSTVFSRLAKVPLGKSLTKKASKRAFMVFLLLVVVCFSRRILGRFRVRHQFAGFACLFGFNAFISLSSSAVIWGKCRMNKTRRQVFSGVCTSLKAGMPLKRTPF